MAKQAQAKQNTGNPGVKTPKGAKPLCYDGSTTATTRSDATKQSMATRETLSSSGNSG